MSSPNTNFFLPSSPCTQTFPIQENTSQTSSLLENNQHINTTSNSSSSQSSSSTSTTNHINNNLLVPQTSSSSITNLNNINNNYYMNGNFIDLDTINEDCLKNRSNHQNGGGGFVSVGPYVNSNPRNLIGEGCGFAAHHHQHRMVSAQRKNTSDSNVKLLADHNFYHVTQRRGNHYNKNSHMKENFHSSSNDLSPSAATTTTSNSSSGVSAVIQNFNNMSKVNDFYMNKLKRLGPNVPAINTPIINATSSSSSSNSLVSLNSSSAGTNEEHHSSSNPSYFRSNPDLAAVGLKNATAQSSNNLSNQQLNNSNSFNHDLKNLSNNLSLNLSIHTAEEFGIEMLEWLNNESKGGAGGGVGVLGATSMSSNNKNATLV
jgi:hypothetical protein